MWSSTHVTLTISQSKTDCFNQGQASLLAQSTQPDSAFQRLTQLLSSGIEKLLTASKAVKQKWATQLHRTVPTQKPGFCNGNISGLLTLPFISPAKLNSLGFSIANLPLYGRWLWAPVHKLAHVDITTPSRYPSFYKGLKRILGPVCPQYQRLGAHSLRRGGTTEKIEKGISREVVQYLGRWRSDKSLESYIEEYTGEQLCARALVQTSTLLPPRPFSSVAVKEFFSSEPMPAAASVASPVRITSGAVTHRATNAVSLRRIIRNKLRAARARPSP